MAFGIFKKIKNGLKKAFNFGKKIVGKVVNKVVDTGKKLLPVSKKIASVVAPLADKVMPGLGTGINTGLNVADSVFNGAQSIQQGKIPPDIQRLIDSGKLRLT